MAFRGWNDWTQVTTASGTVELSADGRIATCTDGGESDRAYLRKYVRAAPGDVVRVDVLGLVESGVGQIIIDYPQVGSSVARLEMAGADLRSYSVTYVVPETVADDRFVVINVGVFLSNAGTVKVANPTVYVNGVPDEFLRIDWQNFSLTAEKWLGLGTSEPIGNMHISSGATGDSRLVIEADTGNNVEGYNPHIWFKQDGGLTESAISLLPTNEMAFLSNVSNGGGFEWHIGSTDNYGETDPFTGAQKVMSLSNNGSETMFTLSDSDQYQKRFFVRGSDDTFGIFNTASGQERTQFRLRSGNGASNDNLSLLEGGGKVMIGTKTPAGSVLRISGLPTSSAGLSPGDVWNDAGTLKIVT